MKDAPARPTMVTITITSACGLEKSVTTSIALVTDVAELKRETTKAAGEA